MKKGEISYKPRLFGACPNPDSCKKISFTAITSCLSCAHAVFDGMSAEDAKNCAATATSSRYPSAWQFTVWANGQRHHGIK